MVSYALLDRIAYLHFLVKPIIGKSCGVKGTVDFQEVMEYAIFVKGITDMKAASQKPVFHEL